MRRWRNLITSLSLTYLLIPSLALCEINYQNFLTIDLQAFDQSKARQQLGKPGEIRDETWIYSSKDFNSIVLTWNKTGHLEQIAGRFREPRKLETIFQPGDQLEILELRAGGDVPIHEHLLRNIKGNTYWKVAFKKRVTDLFRLDKKLNSSGPVKTFEEIQKLWQQ